MRSGPSGPTALIEVAPRTSHASVGSVERANQEMGKQIRALKLALETRVGAIPEGSHVWHWLVRHAGWVLTRFATHASGRKSYQILKGKQYSGEIAAFGESV